MATIKFHGVGITAMSACVPSKVAYNRDLGYLIPDEEIEKTIQSIGIEERRIADDGVTASDLAYKAARKLLDDNQIDPESIDVLLFMSQTSDYRIPATSCILQHRLGLAKTTACIDLTLGCSGYVFALSTAMAYASMEGVNRVLLLDGETFSKIVNRRDKVDWPLYGDAATATLVERGDFGTSTFILNTDGSGEDAVKIHAGMRNPITIDSLVEKEQEEGNIRNELEVYMDGMDVFNFAISRVPRGVKEILKVSNLTLDDINYLVFHQSNKFMTDFFVSKLKYPLEQVPYCIQKYGNTSSASVPLTIVSELHDKLQDVTKVVMCGFGAGLSWGTALVEFKNCKISPVIEY
ncbi:MAG: ketoacyl-ACP synthase III [Muribaculaceae bacterium]|nr:ketoacyl-ACP synthase III [Muribaculaceae bacterium]